MSAAAVHPPASRSAASLVEQARAMLRDAAAAGEAGERFRLAHLAALRGTAALFAPRARPAGKRRLGSAWGPVRAGGAARAEGSRYFPGPAGKRAAVEAGAHSVVSEREAEDQLHAADQFVTLIEGTLGLLAPMAS